MQEPEKLREIEELGEEGDFPQEDETWEEDHKSGWGGAPLLQAMICALAVLALVLFRLTDSEKYQEVAGWYQSEMAKELELPSFDRSTPAPSSTPEPTPSPAPPVQASAPRQML